MNLSKQSKKRCNWNQTPHWLLDIYTTDCGKQYVEWDNRPDMEYCPFCGKRLHLLTERGQIYEILKRTNQ